VSIRVVGGSHHFAVNDFVYLSPPVTSYSSLVTRYSLLATAAAPPTSPHPFPVTRYSLLATRHGGGAAYLSPLVTSYPLLATRHGGCAAPAGPLAERVSDSETGESASLLVSKSGSEAPAQVP